MGSNKDKLFKKRKAKSKGALARRSSRFVEKRRVLVICEGQKTEPNYFRSLRSKLKLSTVDVEICGNCSSAPKRLVQFGIKELDKDDDYDVIFFVFDKDSHETYEHAIREINKLQKDYNKKLILAITSVPCFEVWFLLHYEKYMTKHIGGRKSAGKCVISDLKKKDEFKHYDKGQNCFSLLEARMEIAKLNSTYILERGIREGDDEHHINPSTKVHILIEILEQVATEGRFRI